MRTAQGVAGRSGMPLNNQRSFPVLPEPIITPSCPPDLLAVHLGKGKVGSQSGGQE